GVSRFSAQYSLAIVFQELLTGTRPFNGSNTRQLLMQHINSMPELSPLPLDDQPVIGRALNKKPEDRWPTCAEMVKALRAADQPKPAQQTPPPAGGYRRQSYTPNQPPGVPASGASGPDSGQATPMA